jgi:hypothetical protein
MPSWLGKSLLLVIVVGLFVAIATHL